MLVHLPVLSTCFLPSAGLLCIYAVGKHLCRFGLPVAKPFLQYNCIVGGWSKHAVRTTCKAKLCQDHNENCMLQKRAFAHANHVTGTLLPMPHRRISNSKCTHVFAQGGTAEMPQNGCFLRQPEQSRPMLCMHSCRISSRNSPLCLSALHCQAEMLMDKQRAHALRNRRAEALTAC